MVGFKHKTVLLVDDEEGVRKIARIFLESLGVYVLEAKDAAEALRLAVKCPLHFDLLITDILLSRMNGRDLANRICVHRPDIKVLFISGHPPEALMFHGLCPTQAEFLQKPFDKQNFERKVGHMLEHGARWKAMSSPGDSDAFTLSPASTLLPEREGPATA